MVSVENVPELPECCLSLNVGTDKIPASDLRIICHTGPNMATRHMKKPGVFLMTYMAIQSTPTFIACVAFLQATKTNTFVLNEVDIVLVFLGFKP